MQRMKAALAVVSRARLWCGGVERIAGPPSQFC